MNTWTPVCSVEDIPPLGARVVRRAGQADVAVFRAADNKIFALADKCPHKGGALSQGIVCGDKVSCPLHNWNIVLESGVALAPDVGATRTYAVKIVAGVVLLDLNVHEHA
jgi:nitrite reductase (NADH) small subunit